MFLLTGFFFLIAVSDGDRDDELFDSLMKKGGDSIGERNLMARSSDVAVSIGDITIFVGLIEDGYMASSRVRGNAGDGERLDSTDFNGSRSMGDLDSGFSCSFID